MDDNGRIHTRCARCIRKSHSFPPEHEHLEMVGAPRSNGYTCTGRIAMSKKKDPDSQGQWTFSANYFLLALHF